MERLSRFDVVEANGIAMVVVESELLPPDPAVVVIPLLENYPAVTTLNPIIPYRGLSLVLATRLITPVSRAAVRRTGRVEEHSDRITRALDVLLTGI
ncbi:MAG: CcdB family protein [Proteobacteria bacterium]|nr:CcdB family protein [Pseudomonadota bacterium]